MANHGVLVSCRVRGAGPDQGDAAVRVGADAVSIVVAQANAGSNDAALGASTPVTAAVSSNSSGGASSYAYFDSVFSPTATQAQVFESIGAPFVEDVLTGYNCTILAYGQTGSGKTYATVGEATPESRGLFSRSLELLLSRMEAISSSGEFDVALTASFVDIYQEKLRDLLLPLNSTRLRLREDKSRGVWIEGAGSICVDSVQTGMALLARGAAQRSRGCTAMNAESNRSHSVLLLTFTKRRSNGASGKISSLSSSSTMSIVDLAGSERTQKTSVSGVRLDEAKYINKSLSALGNVINALADGKSRHVPYRDSVLTRLLQMSLGGNAKTHLLLTCSSSATHVDETLSTLRFGARAKCVNNSPHVNVLAEDAGSLRENQRLLQMLRDKIESLGCYIRELETTRCPACRRQQLEQLDVGATAPTGSDTGGISCRCNCGITGTTEDTVREDPPRPTQQIISARPETDLNGSNDFERIDSASVACSAADDIADDVIQSEMRSLRKALAKLAASTSCEVGPQVDLPPPLDASGAAGCSSEQIVELKAQVTRLTLENEQLDAANRSLRSETIRLNEMLRQQDEGDAAETEILRRRLDSAEARLERLQAELAAALHQHEECRALLDAKQREVNELRAQVQKRPPSSLDSRDESEREGDCEPSVTKRKLSTRPFTADELSSPPWRRHQELHPELGEHGVNSGVGLNIQSWWSGEATASGNCDGSSSSTRQRCTAGGPSPPEHVEVSRYYGISSDSVRPLRARLVGLLASLEEETSAFRGLLTTETPVADEDRPLSRSKKSGRRTRDLPTLAVPTAGYDKRSAVSPIRGERDLMRCQVTNEGQVTFNRSI